MGTKVKTRLLIVDRDSHVAESVYNVLGQHNYEFRYVSDHLNALDSCMTFLPNVILMDVTQEPKKAFQFILDLKNYPEYTQAKILLTGTEPSSKVLKIAKALNLTSFISKPLQNQSLSQKIRKLLLNQEAKKLELSNSFTTTCELPIYFTNQIENTISFKSPVKLSDRDPYELLTKNQRLLNCRQCLLRNKLAKGRLYQSTLTFDPISAPTSIRELNNPNLIYFLEEMIASVQPRVLIWDSDPQNRAQLEFLMKRFKAKFSSIQSAKELDFRSLDFFDIIIYGLSGTEGDIKAIDLIKKTAPNPELLLCGTSYEVDRLPSMKKDPLHILPKPIKRNNLLYNMAKILTPDILRKEFCQSAPTKTMDAIISFSVTIREVTEFGITLESSSMIQRNSEVNVNLSGGLKSEDISKVSVLIKDLTFSEESGTYQMYGEYSNLTSYQRASIMYYIQASAVHAV